MAVEASTHGRTVREPPQISVSEGDTVEKRPGGKKFEVARILATEVHLANPTTGRIERYVDRRYFTDLFVAVEEPR